MHQSTDSDSQISPTYGVDDQSLHCTNLHDTANCELLEREPTCTAALMRAVPCAGGRMGAAAACAFTRCVPWPPKLNGSLNGAASSLSSSSSAGATSGSSAAPPASSIIALGSTWQPSTEQNFTPMQERLYNSFSDLHPDPSLKDLSTLCRWYTVIRRETIYSLFFCNAFPLKEGRGTGCGDQQVRIS